MYRIKGRRAVRITAGIALVALMAVVAVSLLMEGAAGARAFEADVADGGGRWANQTNSACGNGIAVPTPEGYPGLVSDCETLLAAKSTLEGTTGNLNWSASRNIRQWEGVLAPDSGRVTELDIDRKNLGGTIPSGLGNLASLQVLDLGTNQLTGGIPSELSNLSDLWALHLTSNRLTGTIPAKLGEMSGLTELSLADNQLSGEIPAKLADIPNLGELYLQHNRLTGEIPSELGGMGLSTMNLSDNRLTGEIPSELGDMDRLIFLGLNNNRLTGEIPSELGNISTLQDLYLSGNSFTGCIPTSLRNRLGVGQTAAAIGIPFCGATTAATATPTPSATPETEATATPTPSATPETGGAVTPTATTVPGATAVATATMTSVPTAVSPRPTAVSPVSGDVDRRMSVLERQFEQLMRLITALTNRIAAIERGGGGTGPATAVPTATPTPSATPVRPVAPPATVTATATATHSPTATRVSVVNLEPIRVNDCLDRLTGSGQARGMWTPNCRTANLPEEDPDGEYYARFYTFTLAAESDVTITLSGNIQTYLYLMRGATPGGSVVEETGASINPFTRISRTLPAGDYTIEASTWDEAVTGVFTLRLEIAARGPQG